MTLQVREGFAAGGHGWMAGCDSSWPCPAWGRRKEGASLLGLPPCARLPKPETSLLFQRSHADRAKEEDELQVLPLVPG